MPVDGGVLRAWRRSLGWDVPEMARRLRQAAGDNPMPVHDALVRMIRRWETGRYGISERYELLYAAALGIEPEQLSCGPSHGEVGGPATHAPDRLTERRLQAFSAGQVDELVGHLGDQWHALVKTDNLLGPRHALAAVHDHLGIIRALLRSSRPPLRAEVLRLGAQYAESAAWLHEDSGDMPGSRY